MHKIILYLYYFYYYIFIQYTPGGGGGVVWGLAWVSGSLLRVGGGAQAAGSVVESLAPYTG